MRVCPAQRFFPHLRPLSDILVNSDTRTSWARRRLAMAKFPPPRFADTAHSSLVPAPSCCSLRTSGVGIRFGGIAGTFPLSSKSSVLPRSPPLHNVGQKTTNRLSPLYSNEWKIPYSIYFPRRPSTTDRYKSSLQRHQPPVAASHPTRSHKLYACVKHHVDLARRFFGRQEIPIHPIFTLFSQGQGLKGLPILVPHGIVPRCHDTLSLRLVWSVSTSPPPFSDCLSQNALHPFLPLVLRFV